MTTVTPEDRYREELQVLIQSFEFELCTECGKDIDRHSFAPDPLGKPHQYCLDEAETGFGIHISTADAAFEDDTDAFEVARILEVVVGRLGDGERSGRLYDINGNDVGSWRLT